MNQKERKICEEYSARGENGLVRCSECPLVVDHNDRLCKANAKYNRATKSWELKEDQNE